MKILIACDMEGITGVVKWDHVDSKHAEYGRFRRLMTADVNAAIRGALDGGADEVLVVDGHGGSTNLLIEEIETVTVKQAHGNMAAECLSPEVAQEAICAAAVRAVERLQAGASPVPYNPATPLTMTVDFHQVEMAARAAVVPGVQWDGSRRIEFTAPEMPTAFRYFWSAVTLARS